MAATTLRKKPRRTQPVPPRVLLEWSAAGDHTGPALKIDAEKKIIYGVRVLGRFSRNSHGLREAENGTEYTTDCLRESLPLYEGAEVLANHETLDGQTTGLKQKKTDRGVEYVVGVLREPRMEGTEAIRADFHYFGSHPITPRLLEDVERRLGVFGLSHDARAARERFDPAAKRLVIEKLASVASVDLVRRPATNSNLWENHREKTVPKTLRDLLEAKKYTGGRAKLLTRLFEMDDMGATDAPMPEDDAGGDEDDALWSGFKTAIMAILDGDATADEKAKKIGKYIKGHAKLTGDAEPKGDELEEECDDEPDPKKKPADDKQESVELTALRAEKGVRKLCESLSFAPTELQLEALVGVSEPSRRKLIESFKGSAKPSPRPTSGGPPGNGGGASKLAPDMSDIFG